MIEELRVLIKDNNQQEKVLFEINGEQQLWYPAFIRCFSSDKSLHGYDWKYKIESIEGIASAIHNSIFSIGFEYPESALTSIFEYYSGKKTDDQVIFAFKESEHAMMLYERTGKIEDFIGSVLNEYGSKVEYVISLIESLNEYEDIHEIQSIRAETLSRDYDVYKSLSEYDNLFIVIYDDWKKINCSNEYDMCYDEKINRLENNLYLTIASLYDISGANIIKNIQYKKEVNIKEIIGKMIKPGVKRNEFATILNSYIEQIEFIEMCQEFEYNLSYNNTSGEEISYEECNIYMDESDLPF